MNVGTPAPAAATPPGDFDAILSAYTRARDAYTAALDVLVRATADKSRDADLGLPDPGSVAFDAMTKHDEALDRLLSAPAPDLFSLARKLQAVAEAPSGSTVQIKSRLEVLLADAHRVREAAMGATGGEG